MKKCPYCAEEIQEEAVKCKHCGSDLLSCNHTDKNNASSKITAISVIVVIVILLFGCAVFLSTKNQIKNEVTNFVVNKYGYTDDKYSFKIKDSDLKNATLTVTANNENIYWDIKCIKSSGNWEITSEQYNIDSKIYDELMSALLFDKGLFMTLLKRYDLKYPNIKLKEKMGN